MHAEVNLAALGARARTWRPHWPLAVLIVVAAALLFTNLHRDTLWADEGDTAVLARNILQTGVPTAWDGRTFTDSDFGARVNDDLVMVSHPWLQYYLTAASFAVLGETAFASRVPFAVLGLVTIILVYVILMRVTAHRWVAASAGLLLLLSVQFLIYSRTSRYYTLNAALTCLMVIQFLHLRSWATTLWFALVATLLFHSHPIALAPLMAFAVLALVYRPLAEQRRWLWRALPIVAVFTLPWLAWAASGYAEGTSLPTSQNRFLPRLAQFAVECASVTSVIGALALGLTLIRRRPAFEAAERQLILVLVAVMAAYGVAMALTQPRDTIWSIGMRYTPAVLPFMAMIGALLIWKVSRGRWQPWVALLLVFGVTKVGRLTPWTFWQDPRAMRDPATVVTFHNPERMIDRVLRTGQVAFVQSLFESSPGTTSLITEFLNRHAGADDVVVTNYAWEPIYFHTGRPQGMTVLPSYPVHAAARSHELPEYVFSADGARWIVFRQAWGAYRGQRLDEVLANLKARNIPVRLVATIPETLWENRENIHFRRFPGKGYIYPWYDNVKAALIYRVDWPGTGEAGGPPGAGRP